MWLLKQFREVCQFSKSLVVRSMITHTEATPRRLIKAPAEFFTPSISSQSLNRSRQTRSVPSRNLSYRSLDEDYIPGAPTWEMKDVCGWGLLCRSFALEMTWIIVVARGVVRLGPGVTRARGPKTALLIVPWCRGGQLVGLLAHGLEYRYS